MDKEVLVWCGLMLLFLVVEIANRIGGGGSD